MKNFYKYIWLPVKTFIGRMVFKYLRTNSRLTDSLMLFGLGIERLLAPERVMNDTATNIEKERKYGVNLSGVLQGEFGMGKSGVSLIKSMEAAGISYVVNYVDESHKNVDIENRLNISSGHEYPVNLMHVNAGCSHQFFATMGSEYFRNKYNIGYWMWESDRVPEEWYDSFSYYDEIWAPTGFVLDMISSVSPLPVVRIPITVNLDVHKVSNARSLMGVNDHDFLFLFVFDFYASIYRKNPVGLVKAFNKAFSRHENVNLILKSINHQHYPEYYKELKKEIADSGNIKIINDHIEKNMLYSLFSSCDCYVSLHRSEGFGLTIAEAMYLEKPVIATGYSGNMDFMNVNNSFPVKYEMTEIGEKEYPPFRKGFYWADPDIDHAAELMRYVYENSEEANEKGRRASEDIKNNFSPDAVGKRIRKRLDMIYDSGLLGEK